jgi:Amt family ammonium transporter
MLGSLLLAFFSLAALGGAGLAEGMTAGKQLGVQALAVGVVALWSAAATWILTKLIGLFVPVRVDQESEYDGLDLAQHGERAYEYP